MTTPTERMQSLRWGFELLDAVRSDQRLAGSVRLKAQTVFELYPYGYLTAALGSQDPPALPDHFEQGLDEARTFILELRADPSTPDDLKQHATYVQRHYPVDGSTSWVHLKGSSRILRDWVELEGATPN